MKKLNMNQQCAIAAQRANNIQDCIRKGAANREGEIRLGILRTLGIQFIPRLAARFLEEHPEAEIHFSFHTGITRELLSGLLAQKYDLAFCSEPPEELELTSVPVGGQELALITPKDHPLAALSQVDLSQTLPYPQVYFSPGSGMRDVVHRLFEQPDWSPRALESPSCPIWIYWKSWSWPSYPCTPPGLSENFLWFTTAGASCRRPCGIFGILY